MRFGTRVAAQYEPIDTDEVWIRNFRDETTQLRFVPTTSELPNGRKVYGADAWPWGYEHYDQSHKMGYPCTEEESCIGCKRNISRSRKYYANAIDDQDELRLFRVPASLHDTLSSRQQRAIARKPENTQPLSDQDYLIHRMGKGLDTSYDPEPGERYEMDFPEERHDVGAALEALYQRALRTYGEDGEVSEEVLAQEKDEETKSKPPASRRGRPASKGRRQQVEEPEEEAEPEDEAPPELGDNPSEQEIEETDTGTLKDWLRERKVEFPARAPRARIVALAVEKAAEPPF